MNITLKRGLIGLALAGTTALPALAADISWIYCGDKIDPAHEKYIAEWNTANPDTPVKAEVVGWAQCQDKATIDVRTALAGLSGVAGCGR